MILAKIINSNMKYIAILLFLLTFAYNAIAQD